MLSSTYWDDEANPQVFLLQIPPACPSFLKQMQLALLFQTACLPTPFCSSPDCCLTWSPPLMPADANANKSKAASAPVAGSKPASTPIKAAAVVPKGPSKVTAPAQRVQQQQQQQPRRAPAQQRLQQPGQDEEQKTESKESFVGSRITP
eukprot:1158801-Pelagomonas_calceolata.AAC.4